MNITLAFGTGSQSNALSGRTSLPALSTIEDGTVGVWLDESVHNYGLSAIVTSVTWAEVRAGDGGYSVWGPKFYTFEQSTTLPYQLQTITTVRKAMTFALSATGAANASGNQLGIYSATLSSVALSGSYVRVPVDTTVVYAPNTLVGATLTPYSSKLTTPYSVKEAQRKRLLGYI